MLPSRLYRNLGIPPPLRSLIHPSPSLPANLKVQLRLRLGVFSNPAVLLSRKAVSTTAASGSGSEHGGIPERTTTTASSSSATALPSASAPSSPASSATGEKTVTSQELPEKMEPQLQITFTCTVPDCGTRSTHQFTKRSYEKGIVLIECPGCHNRHLIADHLGWFKDSTGDGKHRTVEDILRARGETVRRGHIDGDKGVVEYSPE